MGKASKALKGFIEDLPDDQLSGFTKGEHTLYKDDNFRLDMHGLTSGDPQYYKLQVQINKQNLKKETGMTVATALVPSDGSWTPAMIRAKLLSTMIV